MMASNVATRIMTTTTTTTTTRRRRHWVPWIPVVIFSTFIALPYGRPARGIDVNVPNAISLPRNVSNSLDWPDQIRGWWDKAVMSLTMMMTMTISQYHPMRTRRTKFIERDRWLSTTWNTVMTTTMVMMTIMMRDRWKL